MLFRSVQNFDTDVIVDSREEEADILCRRGTGVVIDAGARLVLTDRGTVPQPLGDIEVSLGESSYGATVWFVHPLHSLVVLRLEAPGEAGSLGVAATFEDRCLEPGDDVHLVSMDGRGQPVSLEVKVRATHLAEFPRHCPPRWRERNLEAVLLAEDPPGVSSGVLCDERGHVSALFTLAPAGEEGEAAGVAYGVPARAMLPTLEQARGAAETAAVPRTPSLELEFRHVGLRKLRQLPARLRPPAEWLAKLRSVGDAALQVVSISSRGPCDGAAVEGDLLVAVGGEAVATAQAVEAKLHASWKDALGKAAATEPFRVRLTLLTRGKPREVEVTVPVLGSDGVARLLCWHGLILQETPRAVRELGPVPSGVYISRTMLGSPGEADNVEGDFLVAVEGVATDSLDAVMQLSRSEQAAQPQAPGACRRHHIRVESADLRGHRFMTTLQPDPLFWPVFELSSGPDGRWSYVECSS